jgi:hypothetical protein
MGCGTDDVVFYEQALSNFVYEADKQNELRVYDRVDLQFFGDCEDFAFTLQNKIGGDVWHVILKDGQRHAVLVKNNITYDYLYRNKTMKTYNAKFLFIMLQ